MYPPHRTLLAFSGLTVCVSPAIAQQVDEEAVEIVVTGSRERGSVQGSIEPEIQLRPADIRATGATSVSELLSALAPQLDTRGSGPPVVLLNGQRISGFSEIRDIPAEAIVRVDILPPETALRFGFASQQRVANIVLRRNFKAVTLEAIHAFTEEGGAANPQGEANLLRIQEKGRLTLSLKAAARDSLTEAQRDIPALSATSPFDVAGTVADPSRFRTLTSKTHDYSANFVLNRSLNDNLVGTINAVFGYGTASGLRGLPSITLNLPAGNPFALGGVSSRVSGFVPALSPIEQSSESKSGRLGFTLAPNAAKWRWTLTGSVDRQENQTISDGNLNAVPLQARLDSNDPLFNPFAGLGGVALSRLADDRANVRNDLAVLDLLVSGAPFRMPAGEASLSIRVGGQYAHIDNRSTRSGLFRASALSRSLGSGQLSLDVPIASKSKGVLGAIGSLSLNANAALQRLSDFGSISTLGAGLVWSPAKPFDVIASYKRDESAPSLSQLGNPQIATANIPFFDVSTGQSVFVTQISGGNPALLAPINKAWRIEAGFKPFQKTDLKFSAIYARSKTRNAINGLPLVSAVIQQAFPDRFVRGAAGDLQLVDARPINLASRSSETLRTGFNFSKLLKSSQQRVDAMREMFRLFGLPGGRSANAGNTPQGEQAGSGSPPTPADGSGPPSSNPGRSGGGFRGPGGGAGGPGGGGRLFFSLYHTLHLNETAVIRSDVPTFDLLDGSSLAGGGGFPRHEFDAQMGASKDGFGTRISVNWQSASRVDSGSGMATDQLRFGSIGTVDLRMFVNLGVQPGLVKRHRWLRGTRVSFGISNLFGARQDVTDGNGNTPRAFLPAYLDPLGTTFRVSLRKVFF
jgi:iron complex outermembrane recepter protein